MKRLKDRINIMFISEEYRTQEKFLEVFFGIKKLELTQNKMFIIRDDIRNNEINIMQWTSLRELHLQYS